MSDISEYRIAVLGWGSLIPDPRDLAIKKDKKWNSDGPLLPIEFARISGNKRLTLVVNDGSNPIVTLWTEMKISNLEKAKENLRLREGMYSTKNIGFVDILEDKHSIFSNKEDIKNIKIWCKSKNFDAVIWTGLKGNFSEKIFKLFNVERDYDIENIIWYFNQLNEDEYDSAKAYILDTPKSTKTDLRKDIEKIFSTS